MNGTDQILTRLAAIEAALTRKASPWLSLKQAAAYLATSETTIHRWVDAGKLKAYRVDAGSLKFHRRDCDSLVLFGGAKVSIKNRQILKDYEQA